MLLCAIPLLALEKKQFDLPDQLEIQNQDAVPLLKSTSIYPQSDQLEITMTGEGYF